MEVQHTLTTYSFSFKALYLSIKIVFPWCSFFNPTIYIHYITLCGSLLCVIVYYFNVLNSIKKNRDLCKKKNKISFEWNTHNAKAATLCTFDIHNNHVDGAKEIYLTRYFHTKTLKAFTHSQCFPLFQQF